MQRKKTLTYIVSPRYSGSTLLGFVIGYFDKISTIGERKKFYVKAIKPDGLENRCSCGTTFLNCPKWNEIKRRFYLKTDATKIRRDFTQFTLSGNPVLNHRLSKLVSALIGNNVPAKRLFRSFLKVPLQLNEHLIDAVMEADNTNVFLDTSKPINHALFLSLSDKYQMKVICLNRRAPAQIASARKYNDWSLDFAIDSWNRETWKNLNTIKRWKVESYHLSYEKFCQDYRAELKKLLTFLGLEGEYSGEDVDFRVTEQHIMGNQDMRLGKSSEIRERDDWRNRLTSDEVKYIGRKTKNIQTAVDEACCV